MKSSLFTGRRFFYPVAAEFPKSSDLSANYGMEYVKSVKGWGIIL